MIRSNLGENLASTTLFLFALGLTSSCVETKRGVANLSCCHDIPIEYTLESSRNEQKIEVCLTDYGIGDVQNITPARTVGSLQPNEGWILYKMRGPYVNKKKQACYWYHLKRK